MPELPEVETVRRILARELVGKSITDIRVEKPTFNRPPDPVMLARVRGRRLSAVDRKGKYLLLGTDNGAALTLHLGMSGSLVLRSAGELEPKSKHCRLTITFEDRILRFIDPRRFGRAGCVLPKLGPEPLGKEFDETYLPRVFKRKTASVKAALLDQRILAGLGNIYATEALYEAGLRPGRAAGRLKKDEISTLRRTIRDVLRKGIELGGSTLSDEAFLDPLGRAGRAQTRLAVYGRSECRRGHALRATSRPISGRTSLYCPECQR